MNMVPSFCIRMTIAQFMASDYIQLYSVHQTAHSFRIHHAKLLFDLLLFYGFGFAFAFSRVDCRLSTFDSSFYCMIALYCVYDSFFILSKIELWFGLDMLKLLNEPDIYVQYTHLEFNILFGISVNERVYFLNLITIDVFLHEEKTQTPHILTRSYTHSLTCTEFRFSLALLSIEIASMFQSAS